MLLETLFRSLAIGIAEKQQLSMGVVRVFSYRRSNKNVAIMVPHEALVCGGFRMNNHSLTTVQF